ncbi:chlorophyll a/b-binding protein [Cyanothece sp. BG0011]|nr:chlorophyll a/b-binding protein [Cyanothece sp. BG0011]
MDNQETKLGFTEFAETWNGRLAMLGFVIGVAVEYFTGQGILSQLGIM